jgi:lipopolysaccharide/colanic/teichoic acid biosynthesis glycosyltransferase
MSIGTFVYSEKRTYMQIRRMADVVLSVFALCLTLPILLVAAIAILIEDGYPVIFAQRRVGRFEKTFVMYKLRTMKKERCGDDVSPSDPRDLRVTWVGRWLRRTSIDELPQLINVLRGDMALVGPRPEMPFIVSRYEGWQHLRHLVQPGLTGLWQISERSNIPLARPEATLLDLEYVRTASPATDGILLAKTIKAVLSANGAF